MIAVDNNHRSKPLLMKSGVHVDNRGLFFPLDLAPIWIQSNISISKKWTFRGLHHQRGKFAQSKLLSVIRGSIVDFIVDLRYGSFDETYFFRLQQGEQLYIPKGFAHGFLALEDDTIVQYIIDAPYSLDNEISFNWKSNETIKELIMSEVDDEKNISISLKDSAGYDISQEFVETIDYSAI